MVAPSPAFVLVGVLVFSCTPTNHTKPTNQDGQRWTF